MRSEEEHEGNRNAVDGLHRTYDPALAAPAAPSTPSIVLPQSSPCNDLKLVRGVDQAR